jgi:hypothetical protein
MQQIIVHTRKRESANFERSLLRNVPKTKDKGRLGTFKYDRQFLILLLPCILLVIVCGGGKYFLAVAAVGMFLAYIFEALNFRTIALIVIWCTLGLLYITQLGFGIFMIRFLEIFAIFKYLSDCT